MATSFKVIGEDTVLDLPMTDSVKVHQLLERGLPYGKLSKFVKFSQLPMAKLLPILGMSESTNLRRKHAKRLNTTESDKLLRVAKVYQVVLELFNGHNDSVARFLLDPHYYFQDQTPLSVMSTEVGTERLRIFALRLMHGVMV